MIIFYPNMICFWRFQSEKYEKSGFGQVILHKNFESTKFTNKKHGKPTLHSLIAYHVLEMSVKLRSQCVCFKKKLFCSRGFESVSYLFLSRPVHTMRLVLQDSLLLLCWNQRNDSWMSEFESSCVRAKSKLFFQPSVYQHTYRFYKRWLDLL